MSDRLMDQRVSGLASVEHHKTGCVAPIVTTVTVEHYPIGLALF